MNLRNLIDRNRLESPHGKILISPPSFLALVVLAALLSNPSAAHSQALRPGYLSEMPAPARIQAEIKGKDAGDAAERQLGAFITLRTMIGDLAYGLEHRFESQLTPDEQRIQLAYYNAYVDLWHKTIDKFGKQYEGSYDHDRDLRNELLDKFFSADFKALFTKSNQQTAKQIQAARDRVNGNNPANQGSGQPATPVGGPGTTAEMNRCVASGRSLRRCFTDVMSAGFAPFALGINPAEPIPIPPGLRMTGDYAGGNGFRVIFEPEAATLVCRGVPSPLPYTVEITNTEVLVNVQNGSKPVVFSLRQDGKLSSSGPIRVTGQVPAGSHTETTMGTTTQQTTRTKELTPLEASQYPNATKNGQVYNVNEDATQLVYGPTGTSTVTNFVTKTADCNGGILSPIGGSPLPMIKQMNSNPIAMLTTIFSGTMTLMNGGSAQDSFEEMLSPKSEKPIAPGLRMHGRYVGSTGFSLTFHAESVTLGCGQAEQALAYSVERVGSKTMLMVKEGESPISFQLMSDGSVSGERSIQVNGRVITGTTEDPKKPFIFAPRVERCEVGRLVAGDSAGNTPTALNTTSTTPNISTPGSTSSPVVTQSTGTGGKASLTLSSGPTVAGLLAGKTVMVLKDSLENALAQAGLSAQGRSSRVSAWAHACETSTSDQICQLGANGLRSFYVASTKLDANGSSTFTTIPNLGSFYLIVDTSFKRHLMWNVRIELKPGANSIMFDESNMTPIDR